MLYGDLHQRILVRDTMFVYYSSYIPAAIFNIMLNYSLRDGWRRYIYIYKFRAGKNYRVYFRIFELNDDKHFYLNFRGRKYNIYFSISGIMERERGELY